MKDEILARIGKLGGDIDGVKGKSLKEDILSISFSTVLYQRPKDTPWQTAEQTEPIHGIGQFIDENKTLHTEDTEGFYKKLTTTYYQITEEGRGQMFWVAEPFTPFTEGTEDFKEWNDEFKDGERDISEFFKATGDETPEFIKLFYSYGFPDSYYLCLSDPNPNNPILYGTDHETFFSEITNEGNLEDFLKTFITKEDLVEMVKVKIQNPANK